MILGLATQQTGIAVIYLIAAALLAGELLGRRKMDHVAILLVLVGCALHLFILQQRWLEFGRLPIVTRYENISVDSLAVVGIYLLAQWRVPQLRVSGVFILPVAAIGLITTLWYSQGSFPLTPALRTNWLVIHASLNSLAVGAGTLAAAAILVPSATHTMLKGRLLAWAFLLWCAMIAAGSYWASLSWGRFWGWDPIESWSLATALVYGFILHLRLKPAWRPMKSRLLFGWLPFTIMMFTTYGLLMVRSSAHGQYLFQ